MNEVTHTYTQTDTRTLTRTLSLSLALSLSRARSHWFLPVAPPWQTGWSPLITPEPEQPPREEETERE